MENIIAISKREFRSYFNSPIAYIYIATFLIFVGWLFFRPFFLFNQADMRPFFGILPWIYLFFVPVITMRLWAEEKKLGTIEILMTLPVKDYEVILGKFFASFLFLSVAVVLTFPLPLTVSLLGNADIGPIVGAYIGCLLMGAAYIAIGLFVSSLTENQIIAFIVGVSVTFVLLVIGTDMVLLTLPPTFAPLFSYLGLGTHFQNMAKGVIDSRDIFYYLSVIGLFLLLNARYIETRRWR
jgi:ABC-2 type transport system permease protein